MRIYLAGPMTGHPDFNFPEFDAAAAKLREQGHEVFSPAENDRDNGFHPQGMTGHEDLSAHGYSLRQALLEDVSWICKHAEMLVFLPGSYKSRGATAEIYLANALRIPVFPLDYALERP